MSVPDLVLALPGERGGSWLLDEISRMGISGTSELSEGVMIHTNIPRAIV
jgi:hypothetical protein